MARLTGKNGRVRADGANIANVISWSLSYAPQTLSHRGAGADQPTISLDYTAVSGAFVCESNPTDEEQSDLLGEASEDITLTLEEDSGFTHEITNCIVYGGINLERGGKVMRQYQFMRASFGSSSGSFQLNGGGFSNLPDPICLYHGKDMYGAQGQRLVYGPYEKFTLVWDDLSSAQVIGLKTRIDSTNGERVSMTLAVTSPTIWTSYYGCIQLMGLRWQGVRASDVTVEVTMASTTA